MTQHTPGPWLLRPYTPCGENRGYTVTKDTGDVVIADVTTSILDPDIVAVNARLIAAAPEMLALLERLIEVDANPTADSLDITSVADEARVLLAKIEGR